MVLGVVPANWSFNCLTKKKHSVKIACLILIVAKQQINLVKIKIARMMDKEVLDEGPFYHGTRADLQIGDLLTAGYGSNYKSEIIMNHIYFTALPNGAGLAAALAKGDGEERVYIVEPTGVFENDPNVTDKKFPGNPTRSYRSQSPLRIVGELTDWVRQTPEELQIWRDMLAKINEDSRSEIIN